jgi:hypothetical protein
MRTINFPSLPFEGVKNNIITTRFYFFFLITLLNGIVPSQSFAQVAHVNPPTGGFAIDGNLRANSPTANTGDWIFGTTGSGGFVLNNNGKAVDTSTTGRSTDLFNSNSDNIFTSGSKFNDYISALKWAASSATSKDDINNGLYHVSSDPGPGPHTGDQWIFVAGDRLSTSGTSYIDFELLQGTITVNGISSGAKTFTGSGPDGGRTNGDINISMEYTNGGSKPNVVIYRWRKNASNVWFWDSTGSFQHSLDQTAFAETNRDSAVVEPFNAFGNSTYARFAFVEGAVNITSLLSSSCDGLTVKTIWIKTKASAASTAALKDFMMPIPVNIKFGEVDFTMPKTVFCANDDTLCLPVGTPSGGTYVTGNGVVAGGNCASGYYFDPGAVNLGTKDSVHVNIIYEASAGLGCTARDTVMVAVWANPVKPVLSVTQPTCIANGSVTVTSPTGTQYEYSNNGGSYQSSTTFSVAANATFSISVRNKNSGCLSDTTNGTMGAQPSAPNFTVCIVNPTLCDKGSLTITPDVAGSYHYSIDGTTFTNTTGVFNNLITGDVTNVKVRNDANGCTTSGITCANLTSSCGGSITNRAVNSVETRTEAQATVKAYPNPFNDKVKFAVNSPDAGTGSLEIYNLLGQKIKTVYQGRINAGSQVFEMSIPKKQQSTLIYVFRVGARQITGKLLQLNN